MHRSPEVVEVAAITPGRRASGNVSAEVTADVTANGAAYDAAAELLKALAAPTRLAIIELLCDGPRCVHELVDALRCPQPLVSQHLKVLRAAGLVATARRGREISYSLADQHVSSIVRDAVQHAGER
jgi:DNA-binding transcriptional ArsR family regulator